MSMHTGAGLHSSNFSLLLLFATLVSQAFKKSVFSVSRGKLRGVRGYITGFVLWPSAYSAAGLSKVVQLQLPEQNTSTPVNGEVLQPSEYGLPFESRVSDAICDAGGLTPSAYLFAIDFQREGVRVSQQRSLDRVLRDMETELVRESSTQRVSNAEEAARASAPSTANRRLIERRRSLQRTGRMFRQIAPETTEQPDIRLEDEARLAKLPSPAQWACSAVCSTLRVTCINLDMRWRTVCVWLAGQPRAQTRAACL